MQKQTPEVRPDASEPKLAASGKPSNQLGASASEPPADKPDQVTTATLRAQRKGCVTNAQRRRCGAGLRRLWRWLGMQAVVADAEVA